MYCERDTEIVNQFMVKLSLVLNKYIKDWYLVCFSISGIAYNIFKNNFNNFEIDLKLNYNIDIVLRKAYYGGRCEVFGNAYEDDYIYHFDWLAIALFIEFLTHLISIWTVPNLNECCPL